MKKYTKSFIIVFSVHILMFAYLFTVGTLKIVEGNPLSSVLPIITLSAISFFVDYLVLIAVGRFLMWLFKNKTGENWFFVLILFAPIGLLSVALQIFAGGILFGVKSTVQPFAMLFFGWVLITLSSNMFKYTITRKDISIIFVGDSESLKQMAENFTSAALAKNLTDFKKLNKKYIANRYFLLDLDEAEVADIVKLLTYQPATITYLYSSEDEPKFNRKNLENWDESHNFSVVKLTDAELGLTFRRISRNFL